jgi:hypothetical protein
MTDNLYSDFIETVIAGTPVKDGNIIKFGLTFFDTPYEMTAIFSAIAVPHIAYQEEGFTHWISGEFITVNQGFISKKITGQVNRMGWSNTLGLPFDKSENNDILLSNQDAMLEQLGVIQTI